MKYRSGIVTRGAAGPVKSSRFARCYSSSFRTIFEPSTMSLADTGKSLTIVFFHSKATPLNWHPDSSLGNSSISQTTPLSIQELSADSVQPSPAGPSRPQLSEIDAYTGSHPGRIVLCHSDNILMRRASFAILGSVRTLTSRIHISWSRGISSQDRPC